MNADEIIVKSTVHPFKARSITEEERSEGASENILVKLGLEEIDGAKEGNILGELVTHKSKEDDPISQVLDPQVVHPG